MSPYQKLNMKPKTVSQFRSGKVRSSQVRISLYLSLSLNVTPHVMVNGAVYSEQEIEKREREIDESNQINH